MLKGQAFEGHEFFIEIGVEEMPSQMIATALHDLQENGEKQLTERSLPHAPLSGYATPRRFILYTPRLARRQSQKAETVVGPPVKVAFDPQGKPTPAAIGFAKSVGVPVSKLSPLKTEKGEYLSIKKTIPSQPTSKLLRDVVPQLIMSLRFSKAMRWNSAVSFIRPIRWLVVLYNGQVVPCMFSGVSSGNISYGHRLIAPQPVRVNDFATFHKTLQKCFVVIDPEMRRKKIRADISRLAKKVGGKIENDDPLIEQAVYATEYPVALCGTFDRSFLALPEEIRSTAMKEHQGFFPLRHTKTNASLPHFIAISNNNDKQQKIRLGNERVLKARFNDAQFYFEEDRKVGLIDRLSNLKQISFHEGLGTLYDKTERLIALAQYLAQKTGTVSQEEAEQAARICKCDLMTGVVREFPSLQGVMGRILTPSPSIGKAIEEQYLPRYTGDRLPETPLGQVIALADKLDTLVGCFGIGVTPTGSEDPYALRRQGMGVIQILCQPSFASFFLLDLVHKAAYGYTSKITLAENTVEAVKNFLNQRLGALLESYKIRPDLIDAVLGKEPTLSPYHTLTLTQALSDLSKQVFFNSLLTSYKRITRILPSSCLYNVDTSRLTSGADRALYDAALRVGEAMAQHYPKQEYGSAMEALATLYAPLDRFFTDVLVMDPNKAIQQNNLAILRMIKSHFAWFGNFAKIQEGGKSHE